MQHIAHGGRGGTEGPGATQSRGGLGISEKKTIDNSFLNYILMAMEEILMSVRRSKGQFSLTIPLKFAMKGGFDKVKYVGISQTKEGNLKVRRIDIGKSRQERV